MPQKKTPISFTKGDKVGSETDYRDALPVNMYLVPKEILNAKGYMIQNYGLTLFGSSSFPSRGGFFNDRQGKHFRVQGNEFIEVAEDGTVTSLGFVTGYDAVSGSNPPVTLDYSFNTQGVLANKQFFLYDDTNGFRPYPDLDVGNPIDFVWIDGFYFFTDGINLYHSLASDEEQIDPLDFGVNQFMPDFPKALDKTQDNKVIVWGRFSTEYFINDATDDFAFRRIEQRAVKVGIVSTHLKAELNSSWYFVGNGRRQAMGVHILGVGTTDKVSTREIDKILDEYDDEDLVEAHMESYTIEAVSFIKIHLPNHTLLFNENAAKAFGIQKAWTLLKSDVLGNDPDRSAYSVYDARIGEWLVGDLTNGNIGIMDNMVATQYDEIVEWLLFSPLAQFEDQSIDEFEIETISGFTASDDATVFISFTYDGNFYGGEKTVEYGMINEYGKRFIRHRLGYVRDIFSMRLRGASRSRMAFARGLLTHE